MDAATPRPWANSDVLSYPDPADDVFSDLDGENEVWVLCTNPQSTNGNEPKREGGEHDAALITTLANNADAFERLWLAADDISHGGSEVDLENAVESLRSLFGEESE
jgi:hypothetical protein